VKGGKNKPGVGSLSTIGEPLNWHQPEELQTENYWKLTDKILLMFRDVYVEFGDKYDFYLKIDDDAFMIGDNMERFLKGYNPEKKATFGYDLFGAYFNVTNGYQAGGPGYVMSKAAFRAIGEKLVSNFTYCGNTGIEGDFFSKFFHKYLFI
jgi:hypothetical protein